MTYNIGIVAAVLKFIQLQLFFINFSLETFQKIFSLIQSLFITNYWDRPV